MDCNRSCVVIQVLKLCRKMGLFLLAENSNQSKEKIRIMSKAGNSEDGSRGEAGRFAEPEWTLG